MACRPRRAGEPMRLPRLLPLMLAVWLSARLTRAETAVTIVDDVPGACRLAAPATGQTLFILDQQARTVNAVDPFAPPKRWVAISATDLDAGGPGEPVRPLAIACIDSNTLAVVCQTGGDWSLRAFRLAPAGADAAAARLLQTVPLGTAPGPAGGAIDVVVSDTRDWLAVVGLPAPLPPVLRAPIAGARLGGFADRLCPLGIKADRLATATSSPFDEWVIFSRRDGSPGAGTAVAFHTNSGRQRLLDLDLDLVGVHDAAYCRGNGTLWVAADGDSRNPGTAGLWRIDAALANGRQVSRPVAVAPLAAPLSVVCLSERAIAVCGGGANRRVLLVNPVAPAENAP